MQRIAHALAFHPTALGRLLQSGGVSVPCMCSILNRVFPGDKLSLSRYFHWVSLRAHRSVSDEAFREALRFLVTQKRISGTVGLHIVPKWVHHHLKLASTWAIMERQWRADSDMLAHAFGFMVKYWERCKLPLKTAAAMFSEEFQKRDPALMYLNALAAYILAEVDRLSSAGEELPEMELPNIYYASASIKTSFPLVALHTQVAHKVFLKLDDWERLIRRNVSVVMGAWTTISALAWEALLKPLSDERWHSLIPSCSSLLFKFDMRDIYHRLPGKIAFDFNALRVEEDENEDALDNFVRLLFHSWSRNPQAQMLSEDVLLKEFFPMIRRVYLKEAYHGGMSGMPLEVIPDVRTFQQLVRPHCTVFWRLFVDLELFALINDYRGHVDTLCERITLADVVHALESKTPPMTYQQFLEDVLLDDALGDELEKVLEKLPQQVGDLKADDAGRFFYRVFKESPTATEAQVFAPLLTQYPALLKDPVFWLAWLRAIDKPESVVVFICGITHCIDADDVKRCIALAESELDTNILKMVRVGME